MKILAWVAMVGVAIFMVAASIALWKVVLPVLGGLLVIFVITWLKYQEYLNNVRNNLEK